MDFATFTHNAVSLVTLTFLEIVLGVDNLVFLSIASAKLPKPQQKLARRLGLLFALVTRLILLASVVWLVHLKEPLFTIFNKSFSTRDLLLSLGGIFLLYKATQEIHSEMEPKDLSPAKRVYSKVFSVIVQIGVLDIIFSLDSVFTAVGLTDQYWIMAVAICIAILTMIFLSEPLSAVVHDHPTIKMLALSFLLLIGAILVADGFGYHVPREYIYFAIFFSIFVELLNTLVKNRREKKPKK
ncbi:MAG: TerC family protein [Gammaproteobacteria bacterium]|nr:TerC family protein [Gammaproteobacteria bacterium]